MTFQPNQKNIADGVTVSENNRLCGKIAVETGSEEIYRIVEVYCMTNLRSRNSGSNFILDEADGEVIGYTIFVKLKVGNDTFDIDLDSFQVNYQTHDPEDDVHIPLNN